LSAAFLISYADKIDVIYPLMIENPITAKNIVITQNIFSEEFVPVMSP
jgi:hypothetical protein